MNRQLETLDTALVDEADSFIVNEMEINRV